MPNKVAELYQAALAADDKFNQALQAQFGEGVTRWGVSCEAFNQEAYQAYQALLLANADLRAECKRVLSVAV